MSCSIVERNAVASILPSSLKRKRESEKHLEIAVQSPKSAQSPAAVCFTNAAFSSTPKKLIGRRRKSSSSTQSLKENINIFTQNLCFEVKSIAEIAEQAQNNVKQKEFQANSVGEQKLPTNPYEVLRKPPKKKKREADIEEACFENAALNLELLEKQFNPFEVQRELPSLQVPPTKCFVNEALNLRGQEIPAARNPFEIRRCSAASVRAANPDGIANDGLEDLCTSAPSPSHLKIGLPFTPTIGCRIDFTNIPISDLTPSKLLAEKLVFSPVPGPGSGGNGQGKRSLGSISEESTMDIGKELDCYQLELENSINEAKLRRNGVGGVVGYCSPNGIVQNQHMLNVTFNVELEQKVSFSQKLSEIVEDDEEEDEMNGENEEKEKNVQEENVPHRNIEQETIMEYKEVSKIKQKFEIKNEIQAAKIQQKFQNKNENNEKRSKEEMSNHENVEPSSTSFAKDELLDINKNNGDVAYASDSDEDLEDDNFVLFKAPTQRFVRAYRRTNPPSKLTVSKESLHSNKSNSSVYDAGAVVDELESKKSSNVKNLIRKSIRRIMHPSHVSGSHNNNNNNNENPKIHHSDEKNEKEADKKEHHHQHHNLLNTIRHSLRRKPNQKQPLISNDDNPEYTPKPLEISIIDSTERTMKFKTNSIQTEYMKLEQLTNEKNKPTTTTTLRNSIRRSTREMRQQIMKSVFHKKQEEYTFGK